MLIHVNYLIKTFWNLNFKIENKKNLKTTGLRNIIIQAFSENPIFLTKTLQILHGQFPGFYFLITFLYKLSIFL